MTEYICMFDEQYVQFHVIRLVANDEDDALNRFRAYLQYIKAIVYNGDDLYVSRLESIKTI